jgi:hypothetical protein
VSPAPKFGTARFSVAGSAGSPSNVSSLNRKAILHPLRFRWGPEGEASIDGWLELVVEEGGAATASLREELAGGEKL